MSKQFESMQKLAFGKVLIKESMEGKKMTKKAFKDQIREMILAEYNGDSGEDALAKFDEYVDEALQNIIKAAYEWHSSGNNQDKLYREFQDDYEGAAYHMIDQTRGSLNEAKKKKDKPEDVAPQEDVDIDVNMGNEPPPAGEEPTPEPPIDAVTPDTTIGDIDPTVKSIQDSLQKAFAQAKTLGDEKLMNQIGNTITMLVRTQVLGAQGVNENENNTEESFIYKKISNVEFEDVDHKDHPDYSDAYVMSADYDGKPMSEEQIEKLNDNTGLVHDLLMDYLY